MKTKKYESKPINIFKESDEVLFNSHYKLNPNGWAIAFLIGIIFVALIGITLDFDLDKILGVVLVGLLCVLFYVLGGRK